MLATNRGFRVNRVDPILTERDGHKEGFIGFNPFYISEKMTGIKRELDIFKKTKLFADVLQVLYDMSGVWNMQVKAILYVIWSTFIQMGTKIQTLQMCMTKDIYLMRDDADAFDNMTTYTQNGKELVFEFEKIVF